MTLFLLLALAVPTGMGVVIEPIHHGSLVLKYRDMVIHVDPWSRGKYDGVAKADLVLVTDIHSDHMDPEQIQAVTKKGSVIIAPEAVQKTVTEARVLRNGETTEVLGIRIEAIPMYNLKRGPGPGKLYHTNGRGNGYLLTLGQERVYISGDTECVPEIRTLKNVDVAFICMNLPYTMTPQEAAGCVNGFKPRVVYPYHHRGSKLEEFKSGVTAADTEVRILDWYGE